MLEFDEPSLGPKIKVVGVGGGGGNAVNTMIEAGIQGVDFVAANTDCQVLETNQAPTKIQIGKGLTKGLGAGANPDIGCAAALEDAQRIGEVIAGADMVFVTAGMGGGTGTGAAPVIARAAREMGALTVGVVTKPFMFEGLQRKKKATAGIAELSKSVDALIVIPNDRLIGLAGKNLTLRESFNMVDSVCLTAVRGISDLVMVPGLINVDFADVRSIMTGMGRALMGSGFGKGERRALDAAQMAITSPLLEDVSINGATGILVNITGGPDLMLSEVNEACSLVHEAADPDANIIFGSVIDPNLTDEVRITVIATGFQSRMAVEASTSSGHAGPTREEGRRAPDDIAHAQPGRASRADIRPAAAGNADSRQRHDAGCGSRRGHGHRHQRGRHHRRARILSLSTAAVVDVGPNHAGACVRDAGAGRGKIRPSVGFAARDPPGRGLAHRRGIRHQQRSPRDRQYANRIGGGSPRHRGKRIRQADLPSPRARGRRRPRHAPARRRQGLGEAGARRPTWHAEAGARVERTRISFSRKIARHVTPTPSTKPARRGWRWSAPR